jgi:hypothetical protein
MAIHGELREGAALTFATDATAVRGNQKFCNAQKNRHFLPF